VTFRLGVFDVFTYTIPGSLYLALIAFLGEKLSWINIGDFKSVPTLVLVGALLIGSYLLGYSANPVAELLDRSLRWWKAVYIRLHDRKNLEAQGPDPKSRAYATANKYLLQALAETKERDVALEISRYRATGLMLRNCAPPFLVACVVSVVEAENGNHRVGAILCALFFGGAVLSCIGQGKLLRVWADAKIMQICYWIPDIDDMIAFPGTPTESPGSVHPAAASFVAEVDSKHK
jgi:hypothetical protein